MKAWLSRFEKREARALLGGAGAIVVIGLYFLAIEPYVAYKANLGEAVQEQRSVLAWMLAASQEAQHLREQRPGNRAGNGQSLLATVDKSARTAGVASSIKRLEPEGENGVRVWLEQAKFDTLILWFGQLKNQHAVTVRDLRLERQDSPGIVNGRIVLIGAAW